MSTTAKPTVLGHDKVWERFRKSNSNQRLASTYLFVGPAGIGKRTVAVRLAQTLLCDQPAPSFQACDECPACKLVLADNHPDLVTVCKPDGKNFIPLELLIGDREHRRREGLCHDISLTPYYGKRKVAIIDDADHLNVEGANCLLKTLEEPPDKSMLILIGTSEHRQLPTILSRSQIIRFQSLSQEHLAEVLQLQTLNGEVEFEQLVDASDGSIALAMKLDDKELFEFRSTLFGQLGSADPADRNFAKALCDFVDNRSKDAAQRREEYAWLADMTIKFFESTMRATVGASDSKALTALKAQTAKWLEFTDNDGALTSEIAADCIERTERFKFHIAANLASANVVASWLNDLGAFARREKSFSLSDG